MLHDAIADDALTTIPQTAQDGAPEAYVAELLRADGMLIFVIEIDADEATLETE